MTGAVLRATNNNWQVAAGMNGGMQVAAAIILLYGAYSGKTVCLLAYIMHSSVQKRTEDHGRLLELAIG